MNISFVIIGVTLVMCVGFCFFMIINEKKRTKKELAEKQIKRHVLERKYYEMRPKIQQVIIEDGIKTKEEVLQRYPKKMCDALKFFQFYYDVVTDTSYFIINENSVGRKRLYKEQGGKYVLAYRMKSSFVHEDDLLLTSSMIRIAKRQVLPDDVGIKEFNRFSDVFYGATGEEIYNNCENKITIGFSNEHF